MHEPFVLHLSGMLAEIIFDLTFFLLGLETSSIGQLGTCT